MAKKLHIRQEYDYHYYVIGLVSDHRIWKLCHEINQSLNLRLSGISSNDNPESEDPEIPAQNQAPPLFESPKKSNLERGPVIYEDTESNRRLEFVLTSGNRSQLPKVAKAFPYFLLIRAIEPAPPDIAELIIRLQNTPAIRSAVDLSHIKNIKQIVN